MREIVEQRQEKPLWDKRHMQHVVRIDPAEKLLDASGFLDLLRDDAYDFRSAEDSAGKLQRAFWPLHSQDISETLLSASRCVIFDNTFNTSAYDLKLGVFSVVDKNGSTRLLACSLMRHEDRESFIWVLKSAQSILKITPNVILTGGDLWLAQGIREVFPMSVHLLCVWHLVRNITKHFKGMFAGGSNSLWQNFYNMFWKILLCSDRQSVSTFDEEWLTLRNLFAETTTASPQKKESALVYLGNASVDDDTSTFSIYALRRKWAYRWTWSSFTMGCNSSQRGESVFALIKARVRPGSLLVSLYRKLHTLDEELDRVSERILQNQIMVWARMVTNTWMQNLACSTRVPRMFHTCSTNVPQMFHSPFHSPFHTCSTRLPHLIHTHSTPHSTPIPHQMGR